MTERDRLIKILTHEMGVYPGRRIEEIAEYLLQQGVIVPPKEGDIIYEVDPNYGVVTHKVSSVIWVVNTEASDDSGHYYWADQWSPMDIGEAYFSREDADNALKEMNI